MKRIPLLCCATIVAFGCGSAITTRSGPEPGKSQVQPVVPPPEKPRDKGEEAVEEFRTYSREKIEEWQKSFIGQEQPVFLKDGAMFEYKISAVKLLSIDVKKSDSLLAPFVGEMEVEVEWTLAKVTNFPPNLVPASSKTPTKRGKLDCLWNNRWSLKSHDDVAKLFVLPR